MASFLRLVAATTTAAASAIPIAFAFSSPSSSSSSNRQTSTNPISQFIHLPKLSQSASCRLGLVRSFTNSSMAAVPDRKVSHEDSAMPELLTEFMVDMKCEGCVNAVKSKLQTVEGIKNVEVDLLNQVVRILGHSPLKTMTEALHQTGRKARLIGQGVPQDFLVSAAVAEFKGPDVFGVVRFGQVSMEMARIEASFSGLSPGTHGWAINEFGDLTRGAASTGKLYDPLNNRVGTEAVGELGTLEANEKGEAFFSGKKEKMAVGDLIGRAVVVYASEDKSPAGGGIAAAVIARSAGVGENYKKLCTCDGTTIWEASDNDFVTSKV